MASQPWESALNAGTPARGCAARLLPPTRSATQCEFACSPARAKLGQVVVRWLETGTRQIAGWEIS
jgi:hypothetical protein